MSWKETYADKLRTPEEAVKLVKSGDHISMPPQSPVQTCWSLSQALAKRAAELENVTIDVTFNFAPELGLLAPGTEKAWKTYSGFIMGPTELGKIIAHDEQTNFYPMSSFSIAQVDGPHREKIRKRMAQANVTMVMITPPNPSSIITFGTNLWLCRSMIRRAKEAGGIIIGEVNPELPIIPGGDNWVTVDDFDYLVESTPINVLPLLEAMIGAPSPPELEEKEAVICAQVAELIDDGDTVMFGGGRIPMKMAPFLEHKVDLGCHTEVVLPLELMQNGVINNRKRNLAPGRTSLTGLIPHSDEDWEWVNQNPRFDMRDMDVNNHPRYVAQNDNMVAINAPLEVNMFGEINIERVGWRYFRGVGGQVEMIMGALMAKNGRSIHGMVSRKFSVTSEQFISTIVPQFTYPGVASIPRHIADFLVTEYGVASLMGKTERERAGELIAVAHPDFRAELKKEMQALLYA